MRKLLTARLELVAATLEIVTADLHARETLPALVHAAPGAGWPPPLVDVAVMQRLKQALIEAPDPQGWGTWYVVRAAERTLIGICGFKSAPRDGAVEIGYTVLEKFQGQGFGTEMIAALVEWAFSSDAVHRILAETLPELGASQRVLQKNGFVRAGAGAEPGVIRFEKTRTGQRAIRSATLRR